MQINVRLFMRVVKPLLILVGLLSLSSANLAADYHYKGELKIDTATSYIEAVWHIELLNPGEEKRTFYIRDTLKRPKVSSNDIIETNIEKVSGFADFWAIHVTMKKTVADRKQYIQIAYEGTLLPEPLPNKINSITPDVVELNVDSFWFPMDASFSKLLSADVTIAIEGKWQAISTGETKSNLNKVTISNKDPRLDIAFTLAREPKLIEGTRYTIFDLRKESMGIGALTETADECSSNLDQLFGNKRSLPVSKIVITDRKESGYARENYIVLTDIGKYSLGHLTLFLCHEFAHFWAKGANFSSEENWLNEALAEYAALVSVRRILGYDTYNSLLEQFKKQIEGKDLPAIWQEGATKRGPYLVLYRKGPLALVKFENQFGERHTIEIVRRFFNQPIKTTPALLEIVRDIAGKSAEKNLKDLLAS